MRNPDILVVGRQRLGINLQRLLEKFLRPGILFPVHQHTGKIGKRDPYVVMLSGINRLVYLNCAAEFRLCLIELAAALCDLS